MKEPIKRGFLFFTKKRIKPDAMYALYIGGTCIITLSDANITFIKCF